MKIRLLFCLCLAVTAVFVGSCAQTAKPETVSEDKASDNNTENDFVSVDDAAKTALKAGDKMPAFVLPDARDQMVSSEDLLKKSNLVLVFYRGEWCPYCNLYLKRLQDRGKDIKANGGALVAVSVESPDDSLTVSEKNKLDFTVLSDNNLELARKFRIVYQIPQKTDKRYKEKGIDLVRDNGTEKPELPISATYIVNQEGEITFAFINPDYKKRLEPDDIIAQLKKIEG